MILILLFSAVFVIAGEEEGKVKIPEGMELIKSGTVNILVPKGAKVTKARGMVIVEDIGAYTGRRFMEMQERLEEIEAKEEELGKEVEQLKKALDEIKGDKQ